MSRVKPGKARAYGSPETFAIEVRGPAPSDPVPFPELNAGQYVLDIAMWVHGRNIWRTTSRSGPTLDYVRWDAVPIAHWFRSNWVPMLHEEALPLRRMGSNGAEAANRITDLMLESIPLSGLRSTQLRIAEDWWRRHALRSADDSGLLPNVVLRRLSRDAEVAWDSQFVISGMDRKFVEASGVDFVPVRAVHEAIIEFVEGTFEGTIGGTARNAGTTSLPQGPDLRSTDERTALEWLAGLHTHVPGEPGNRTAPLEAVERLVEIEMPKVTDGIAEHTTATLLFRSLSPELTEQDLDNLRTVLIDDRLFSEPTPEYTGLVRRVPVQPDRPAWEQGYTLASEVRDELGPGRTEPMNAQDLIDSIGIAEHTLSLSDGELRAASVRKPSGAACILLNSKSRFAQFPHAKNMDIAHELCHLLFDEEFGQPLAVVQGPWAPGYVEQRANAFAAALLLPREGIQATLGFGPSERVVTARDVNKLRLVYGVGIYVILGSLYNLGWLDRIEQEELLGQITRGRLRALPRTRPNRPVQ